MDDATTHTHPWLTIIVAMYNVEATLEQCLTSVAEQKFTDFEVLCINDGSTDNTLAIAHRFAANDRRFRIINQPNGGYGKATNSGLTTARGTYVAFLEPDDFIDKDLYDTLARYSTYGSNMPADVVKGGWFDYYDCDTAVPPHADLAIIMEAMACEPTEFTIESDPTLLRLHPSIWAAIYRRQFLEDHNIRFVEAPGAGWVDNPFAFTVLPLAQKIVWVPAAHYYYRQKPKGVPPYSSVDVVFDRLADIRQVLHTRNTSADVWAAFYRLSFNYLYLMREFGLDEDDPHIYQRISDVLNDMDSTIVHTHRLSTERSKVYYNDFFGLTNTQHKEQKHAAHTFRARLHNLIRRDTKR